MPHQSDRPEPTAHDRQNAAIRDAIAQKQAEEYGDCLRLATRAFGPGWLPSHRHMLISKEEEEKHRRTGEPAIPAATVYTVKNAAGDKRHFAVEDGKVREVANYEEGFGAMLLEPHPTAGFTDQKGVFHNTHRYSLCWAGYELYHPKSAEQLAALRQSRERKKAAREEAAFREANPLFTTWAEKLAQEEADAAEASEPAPPAEPMSKPVTQRGLFD
jgi:hypothetical protein